MAATLVNQETKKLRQRYAHLLMDEVSPVLAWHVLWTRSNCEKPVCQKLMEKGYEIFLPMIDTWTQINGVSRITCTPMFKGYLFLHAAVDKEAYIDISSTDGLVSVLGHRWDSLAHIPDSEIEGIRTALGTCLPRTPYPYLAEGDKVRVINGSLMNTEGILVRTDPLRGLFIVSITLLRRSIAVEIDCSDVVPL